MTVTGDTSELRSGVGSLTELVRGLAECPPGSERLYACVQQHLNGGGFGFARVAVFRDGAGRGETVPVSTHGFEDLEVLHGQLPPVDEWPLFHRTLEERGAVYAPDAQLEGDADELAVLSAVGSAIAAALVQALALDACRRSNELKTQFVALASHELRAPVAAIHGVTSTMRVHGDELGADRRAVLQRTLYEQSDRMRRLVDQLLDLTKLESQAVAIEQERFAVRPRIEALLRQVAPERMEDVRLDVAADLESVADPLAFDRIVSDLVTNAFRYGQPPVTITAQQRDTHFRLWVEDRGSGVPPEFAPRLFERFARGRPRSGDGGSGLGLAIAQSFAQAQGGRLLYEDAQPTGARFQLVLPVRSRL